MVGYAILFGLLLGACYWIINPLLEQDDPQNGFTPQPEDILEALKDKKDGAYAAIRELEFDLSMGKLAEEDFQILKRQYTQEAVGYMQEMDQLASRPATLSKPGATDFERDIEQEVAQIRNPASTAGKYIYCTSCGRKAEVESRFCTACGANLDQHRKNNFQEEN